MNWPTATLAELCEIGVGRTPSRANAAYWEGGSEPWVSISDMKQEVVRDTREAITPLGVKESGAKKVAAGTLLMSFKLSIGNSDLLDAIYTLTKQLRRLLPDRQI